MTSYVVAGVLAVQDQDVSPGVLGFLVVAALGVATWLLIRSMNRQMRKIDLPDDSEDATAGDGSAVADAEHEPHEEWPDGPAPNGRGISPR